MATTERAREFMRNWRLVNYDTHCDRDDCHGTHVDRIDWEIARREIKNATPEIADELEPDDFNLITWANYVNYARRRWGNPVVPPPFERPRKKVVIPEEVAAIGLDENALYALCWICDQPDCRICAVPEGSNRMQTLVLRERGKLKRLEWLNRQDIMDDFFRQIDSTMEYLTAPALEEDDVIA